MRLLRNTVLVAGCLLAAVGQALSAPNAELAGKWKLVVLAFGDDEFALMELKEEDGKLAGEMIDAQKAVLGTASLKQVDRKGKSLIVTIVGNGQENTFHGTVEGDDKPILGSFRFRDNYYPARLERTEAEKVSALARGTLPQEIATAARERDPKARVAALEKLIEANEGKPNLVNAYAGIFQAATDAGLTEDQIKKHVHTMLETAGAYGPQWLAQTRMNALRALGKRPEFAELTLKLAKDADEQLAADASTEERATIAKLYAMAARSAGKTDLAGSLEKKLAELENMLDAEYHEKVPPFKPAAYAGRKNAGDDRVVVMELFTGSECPPCVAADVGFDAILKTYQPTELVALQYHLHIPRPDPLTNPTALDRAKYYGVRSTPSTFFNGKIAAQGGGSMAMSQGKYNQYRDVIDEQLYGAKPGSIDLDVKRSGDKIQITARAKVDLSELTAKADNGAEGEKKGDEPKKSEKKASDAAQSEEKVGDPKPKLYLVVAEQSVRFAGGNKVRFHHNLVRSFAGDANGTELKDGSGSASVTVDLAAVRKEIDDYLTDFQKTGSFSDIAPSVELKGLSIVAFVQDDSSKKILHAVVVPVPEAK